MRFRKMRGLALAISMVLALGACGDDDGGSSSGFDSEARDAYMQGCLEDGNEAFCQCTLDEFEKRFSQDEFERLALQLNDPNDAPEEFVEVIFECIGELEE